ncbi:class I SAM-dependent methyltransferase [Streptomyces anulatus]|uniref:class I SAM-dependent methyltransferase n=1 Tax=Streptomyces anulatus TaxID=1892 RepID=UPI001C2797FD|nr:class I SAM-dependent methyltransferase [Streptomyces anulatus]
MALMTQRQFEDFFEPYAGDVEGFYEAAYWKLSDELVKELIRRHLGVAPGQRVLDAGGGTGRWAVWASEDLGVSVTVADKSRRMLEEAEKIIAASGAEHKVTRTLCDLQDAPELPDESFDAVISTYGVLSFLDDPAAAFRTLHRVLRPGGQALLMSHSLSTALASKVNSGGSTVAELRELNEQRIVRWSEHVPPLRVYTADDLRSLAASAGLEAQRVFGVTSVVAPGPQDFGYPYSEISAVSRALEDEEYFATALALEIEASERTEWSERGTNLLLKARKPDAAV